MKVSTIIPTLVLVFACTPINRAVAFTLTTRSAITQFATPDAQTFTSNDTVFQTLPSISSSQGSPQGNIATSAAATPTLLSARFSTANSSINEPSAVASYSKVGLLFQDNQALRDLIGSSATALNLMLNFNVSYRLDTPQIPGTFKQATSFAHAVFSAFSPGDLRTIGGTASSINGPYEHTFNNSGIFAGLPEQGGDLTVQLPIRISPQGLYVSFNALVETSGLSLDETATGQISTSIPSLPFFVSLPDGTPAAQRGLLFSLIPTVAEPQNHGGGNPTVPEPPTGLASLLVGMGLLSLKPRKRI